MIIIKWKINKMMRYSILFVFLILVIRIPLAQPSWKLWATGLPTGVYPRMAVAPNHDIFYALLGAGIKLGYVYKANTADAFGTFIELPQIPRPSSIQNNIVALGFNKLNEPIVGINRTDISQPWLFRLDQSTMIWDSAESPIVPTLGGHCIATSKEGVIYVGTRWAYVYKSTDDGKTFEVIDDTKSVKSGHPCYFPTKNGSEYSGSIFSLNIDHKGRVYAGTETAGIIYSDDEGKTWHPADLFSCLSNDPMQKDTNSPMKALTISGNAAAIGFTKNDQLVWSGANMWELGWKNKMGFADLINGSVRELIGLPDYLIQTGQQVSKIVTTDNGQMFFHSGGTTGATGVGIYTSRDGIHWTSFNDGITGQNDGLSQGSLAVDGNKVFIATRDGKVWLYEDTLVVDNKNLLSDKDGIITIQPNPANDFIEIHGKQHSENEPRNISLYNAFGKQLEVFDFNDRNSLRISVSHLDAGCYFITYDKIYKFFKF